MSGATTALVVSALLGLSAMFVAAQYAIVTVRPARVQALVRAGRRRGALLEKIVADLDGHVSAIQLAITAITLTIGWLGGPAVSGLLARAGLGAGLGDGPVAGAASTALAFAAGVLVVAILGEFTPKMLGLRRTDAVALWSAPLVYGLARAIRPILALVTATGGALAALLGAGKNGDGSDESEPEELRAFLSELSALGRLSVQKRTMLENVFEFAEHTTRQVMIPRDKIEFLSLERSLEENLALVRESSHTRYPLCESELDSVVGMVHIRDLFRQADQIRESDDLRLVQHDLLQVPESQPIDELQRLFQRKHAHMAIVLDEYGVPTGLVTMEDVLEELVGEIRDEFDEDEDAMITESDDGLIVDGMLLFEDLCRELDVEIEEVDADTVGGYVTSALGRLGRTGDQFLLARYDGEVTEMQGHRVAKVVLRDRIEEGDANAGSDAEPIPPKAAND